MVCHILSGFQSSPISGPVSNCSSNRTPWNLTQHSAKSPRSPESSVGSFGIRVVIRLRLPGI
eukprot:5651531-Heterocapsa_arctica.AAC.1